jgi:hypothetical protein
MTAVAYTWREPTVGDAIVSPRWETALVRGCPLHRKDELRKLLDALYTEIDYFSASLQHCPTQGAQMKSTGTTVISVGINPELQRLRNFVLQSARFKVITTVNENDALAQIQRGRCGVLLVCYSLARSTRQTLAEALRKFCPGARMVLIADEHMEKPEFADAFVYGLEGPEALIASIKGVMSAEA